MSLWDTIILSICVVTLIIGVHQTFVLGFEYSYWIFMLTISLLLLFRYRKLGKQTPTSHPKKGK